MKIICVDDEKLVLDHTVYLCERLEGEPRVIGFSKTAAALESVKSEHFDIALLDIDMPDMNGLTLAARIKEISPDTSVIFLTGYSQYALDAFKVHASGYLLKPVDKEELEKEITHAMLQSPKQQQSNIVIKTFGEFDIFVNGKSVAFSRQKAKEVLAFLVDRQGGSVTKETIFSALWEYEPYDRSKQKYLGNIILEMFNTLKEYGVQDIVERQRGTYRICPEKVDCDLFRFFNGDVDTINSYRGEYMNSYSWARFSEAEITVKHKDIK